MCFNASSSTPWQLVAAERMNEWEREREREASKRQRRQANWKATAAKCGHRGDDDVTVSVVAIAVSLLNLLSNSGQKAPTLYVYLIVICIEYWSSTCIFKPNSTLFFLTHAYATNSEEWETFVLVLVSSSSTLYVFYCLLCFWYFVCSFPHTFLYTQRCFLRSSMSRGYCLNSN